MKRTKKKALTITVCATAVAGIAIMWAVVLKSGGNGGIPPKSSSAIVSESSSADSGVDTTLKENIDIYKSHSYPELADEDMITLAQLAERKDEYADKIMSEDYGNIVFTARPDIFVPDEIGKYQIQCMDEYLEGAEEVIKFLVGDEFDESNITDERKLDEPIHYPISINYQDGEQDEDGVLTSGVFASVGNNGAITYINDQKNIDLYAYGLSDVTEEKTYFLQTDYTDEAYSFGENDMSISQYAKMIDDTLDTILSLIGYKGNAGQLAIVAEKGKSGNVMLKSELANIYKSLPICAYYPMSSTAESECILKVSHYGLVPYLYALTTNGQTVQYLYINSQFKDYETVEKYDKIVAPDKAAKLLSEALAPNIKDNEIIGMGLSYYPYYIGKYSTAAPQDGTEPEIATVYELTPFWTFYFDLDPSIIGLVDCKTGEVAYIHNVN